MPAKTGFSGEGAAGTPAGIESARAMGPISLSTAVDAPRERVFDYLCDLSQRPAWTDHFMQDLRLERIESSGVGSGVRCRVDAPRGIRYMDLSITEAERPHRVVEEGHGGRRNGIRLKAVWELTEGPGAVTTVGLTFLTEPRGRRGGRWWRRRWKKALRRLGQALEAGTEVEQPVVVAGADRLPAA